MTEENKKVSENFTQKIPMPEVSDKVILSSAPLAFWSKVLMTLDKKSQVIMENYGFGEVNLNLIIHRGKITEVIFNDKVRVRGLVEEAEENS